MEQKISMYLMANQELFPLDKIMLLKEKLMSVDEKKFNALTFAEFRNPTTMTIISVFLGVLGVDRFMMGETGMGILKLLTCGACGVLAIMDMCSIANKIKEDNFKKIMRLLNAD